jgi:hypothetical protein
MRVRLNGWHRLGIVISVPWLACVGAEVWVEKSQGPFSRGWLTETIETRSGKPDPVSKVILVPVDQVANLNRVLLVSLVPIAALWIFGFLWSWVRTGFRARQASGMGRHPVQRHTPSKKYDGPRIYRRR